MEKTTRNYNEMYQYITNGETLYDLLKEYTGETDFSPTAIINSLRRDINLQQNIEGTNETVRFKSLASTYRKDIFERLTESMLKNMTLGERDELLKKFQAVNPEKYKQDDVKGYIEFLKDTNFTPKALVIDKNDEKASPLLNPEIEELNKILIETAVDKADPELVEKLRNVIMHMILIPYAKKQILKENPERDESKNPKLHKINLFERMFTNEKAIKEYDSAIAYIKEQEEIARRAAQQKALCKIRRLEAISDLTGHPLPELLTRVDSKDESILDLLSSQQESSKKEYQPKEGDYYWGISLAKRPNTVFNEKIEYSKNGEENQEVVVVSYGNFVYGKHMNKSKVEEYPLELIGVTVFGNDYNGNYFMVTPKANISNMVRGRNKEYYKKVLLSQFVLDEASRGKFLPEISIDENGNSSLKFEEDLTIFSNTAEAVKYACEFPGQIGRDYSRTSTLRELCNSDELFQAQMQYIYEMRKEKASTSKPDDRGEY